jgi:hypothetical protein
MREQIKKEGATVIGLQGRPVAHPLIAAQGASRNS